MSGPPGVRPSLPVTAVVRPLVGRVAVAVLIPDVLVRIVDAPAVIGIVLPVDVAIINVDVAVGVDVDVVVSPVEAIAPYGIADGKARAPGNAARERPADNVAGCGAEIVRRVGGVWPRAIDHRRIVIGNIDCLRRSLLDHDDLLRRRLLHDGRGLRRSRFGGGRLFWRLVFDLHRLLLVRFEHAVRLGAFAQTLDRIHHARLLRKYSVAKLRRPIEVVIHQRQNVRHDGEPLNAVVPIFVGQGLVERFALQLFVLQHPAVRLNHF